MKIRIIVILNLLKDVINPALNNDIYQLWLKTNRKIKFRSWCIDKIKEMILMELDTEELKMVKAETKQFIKALN